MQAKIYYMIFFQKRLCFSFFNITFIYVKTLIDFYKVSEYNEKSI